MDTLNISHIDNSAGTPPSQCSRTEEDNKHSFQDVPSCSTDPPSTSHTPPPRSSSSPPPSCAICLGAFVNKCMPDICLHQFCFNCLLQWSKVKAVCPLCKRSFLSIIHNVRSNYEYDEHVIERPQEPEYFLPNAPQPRHYQFRTTFTVDPRGELAIQQMLSSHPLTFPLGIYEPFPPRLHRHTNRLGRVTRSNRRTYVSSTTYRRSIYEQGLWVVSNPDGTDMHREATPEFYRNNAAAISHLVPWLNRELCVLMQHANTEEVAALIDTILAAIPSHHILSRYMLREVLQPYLHHHSEHFAHEFYNYMRSPLDMIGYDRSCVHGPRVIENINLDDQISDSSDSTVELLDNQTSNATAGTSTMNRFPLFMPAPMSVDGALPVQPQQPSTSAQALVNDVIEIDDSDGNDSDVILQTPPPPTIVDLLGDTSDASEQVEEDSNEGVVGTAIVQQETEQQTFDAIIRQGMVIENNSSVLEVDSYDPVIPSTSRGARKQRHVSKSHKRCSRHDEYMVDRKTVLPLKIRLKRKRQQPSKRSSSKAKKCCRNGGYSSSSSNEASLQSRLKRRRKFHKKKYYLRKDQSPSSNTSSASSSASPNIHSNNTSANDDHVSNAEQMLSFSSDDDEPLSVMSRKSKDTNRQQSQPKDYIDGNRWRTPSVNISEGTIAGTSGTSMIFRRARTKRELREELKEEMREERQANGAPRAGVPPPGVFVPTVPSPSPLLTTSPSFSRSSQSSRYTPDHLVNNNRAATSARSMSTHINHNHSYATAHYTNLQSEGPPRNNLYFTNIYRGGPSMYDVQHRDRERDSHTPPLPARSYSPFSAAILRGNEYYRSGMAASHPVASWSAFVSDVRPSTSASTINHQELCDPMWSGMRLQSSEHTQPNGSGIVLSLRGSGDLERCNLT